MVPPLGQGRTVLITGSSGLVGTALRTCLTAAGYTVKPFDLGYAAGTAGYGDILDDACLERAVAGCHGIVHLAAVSRVVWGERDPELCWRTNALGTETVFRAAAGAADQPWVLIASSREVYGQPGRLPAVEDDPIRPMNIYGRSKAEAERLAFAARENGLITAVVRLANVYGSVADHADRVVPAFCRGAAEGSALQICGADHTFDFTHVDDTVDGLMRIVAQLEAGERGLPPIHLLPGKAISLGELACLANGAGGNRSALVDSPPRNYDVAHFVGDPARARSLLGWYARIDIAEGVRRMVADFQHTLNSGQMASIRS